MDQELQNLRWAKRSAAAVGFALVAATTAVAAQNPNEPVLRVDLLDNGSGAEISSAPEGDERRMRLPWWTSSGAKPSTPPSGTAIDLAPGQELSQPIAAYPPLADSLSITGRVTGQALVVITDGNSGRIELQVSDQEFSWSVGKTGLSPRFKLSLIKPSIDLLGTTGARFHDVQAIVSLPCPSEAELAQEIHELTTGIFKTWLELGVDRDGPRKTSFLTTRFDAVTGELQPRKEPSGINILFESLLKAAAHDEDAFLHASLDAFLKDFFELTLHPQTGMPRDWDGELDAPQDAKPVQVARYLAFLIDVAERGPLEYRERALQQAGRMAETILAHRLPDGAVAVQYVPRDGTAILETPALRQLDVAAQLVRLSKKNGDKRLVDAAQSALAQLEYLHFWGGTWSAIDPDFDDGYGNWGSKVTTMLVAFPDDPFFRRFTAAGFEHFAPMWRDALRFGGSIAADQIRCWELLLRYGQVEPSVRATLDPLLRSAVRTHFKCEQYDTGAWGDVTFANFSPRASLNVGDNTGLPGNLLIGLAQMYRKGSPLRTDETRAMFTALLRSSKQHYGRKFGWLATREQLKGVNVAGPELRLLDALLEMQENLQK